MEKRDLLFEIGVEEIPAAHFLPACQWLQGNFEAFVQSSRLMCESLKVSGTPRRFFVYASQIPQSQPDIVLERTGPATRLAYAENGELSPAALGFLKKNGASPQDIQIQTTDKGDFIAISIHQQGRAAIDLISEWIKGLLPQFPFAKKMIWNRRDLAFSRPVRWLCLLWGAEPIELDVLGLKSHGFSYGNRYLGLDKPLQISSPDMYLQLLAEHGVIADRQERLGKINQELASVFDADSEYQLVPDERLAETVCDLVEYPSAVLASFEEEFLSLPEKIIISTISQNQKYFCTRDAMGRLNQRFVFFSNGDPAKSQIIKAGNEKVVKARLADALWYYQEDCRRPLESYVPALADVVFQAKLGTMAAKVQRTENLSKWMAEELELDESSTAKILRTAHLAKADLVTNMLGEKEFTKLQGYIGKQYALASGEDEEVATGIWEHYAPRGSHDELPHSLSGAIVALADKTDTVCGIIGVGLMPTGSADPFALRRLANGVGQILLQRGWQFSLEDLIAKSFELFDKGLPIQADAQNKVLGFFRQRAEWLLKQEGIPYDVLDSLAHLSLGAMSGFYLRSKAISNIRQSEDFLRLVIGFKRVANILAGAKASGVCDPSLFEEPGETALYDSLGRLSQKLDEALQAQQYDAALRQLVEMASPIDSFFDQVLVNCEDAPLRNNRLSLLASIKSQFLRVADISKIVIETENGA